VLPKYQGTLGGLVTVQRADETLTPYGAWPPEVLWWAGWEPEGSQHLRYSVQVFF
jgi:hypothetical protein